MLSRLFTRSLRLRPLAVTLISTHPPSFPPPPSIPPLAVTRFSSNRPGNGGAGRDDGSWNFGPDKEENASPLFELDAAAADADSWDWKGGEEEGEEEKGDIFKEIAKENDKGGEEEWDTAEGFKPWGFDDEEEEEKSDLFVIGEGDDGMVGELDRDGEAEAENQRAEELAKVELEEKELQGVLKGPNRAFGDLIAASGITDEMLDSLILLKNVNGVEGLPSLEEIEDKYAEQGADTSRYEVLKKQQEVAKERVSKIDEKGRSYGTGKRKCSIARVFIKPGDGKFIINDKQYDAYFTWLDHRAEILSPFLVTETIGRWDVNCTVKGGGLSGQVGAIRLGISRALQNWSPAYRELLKPAGLLTRDSRVVERKKPGKAKARKSFQWVKR